MTTTPETTALTSAKSDRKPFPLGLALSGGGYRAAAFHLGTMRKLHEFKILSKAGVLSTISGGSITGAVYCLKQWEFHEFEDFMKEQLTTKSVIRSVLLSWYFIRTVLFTLVFIAAAVYVLFTKFAWLSPIIILFLIYLLVKFQFALFPASKAVEDAYNKYFFYNKTLGDLANEPLIAIGSSDTQISRPFTFSRNNMGSGTYKSKFIPDRFPIARAVMASSCVPFAFTPIHIDPDFYEVRDPMDPSPELIDGGIYDNQGLHKLTQEKSRYLADSIVVSDAGNKLPFEHAFNNALVLLIRTVDVFMERIKRFQMVVNIYQNTSSKSREIAYISLGWDLENILPGFVNNLVEKNIVPSVLNAHKLQQAWIDDPASFKKEIIQHLETSLNFTSLRKMWPDEQECATARSVGTNLTKLSPQQVKCLSKLAYVVTDVQVRLYCPSLL